MLAHLLHPDPVVGAPQTFSLTPKTTSRERRAGGVGIGPYSSQIRNKLHSYRGWYKESHTLRVKLSDGLVASLHHFSPHIPAEISACLKEGVSRCGLFGTRVVPGLLAGDWIIVFPPFSSVVAALLNLIGLLSGVTVVNFGGTAAAGCRRGVHLGNRLGGPLVRVSTASVNSALTADPVPRKPNKKTDVGVARQKDQLYCWHLLLV